MFLFAPVRPFVRSVVASFRFTTVNLSLDVSVSLTVTNCHWLSTKGRPNHLQVPMM
jgi:hypothetical protein